MEKETTRSLADFMSSIKVEDILTKQENEILKTLLYANAKCLATDLLDLQPPIGIEKHRINTITNVPIKLYAYRKSYHDREI